jgi:PTS system nitrogen regulatory IIA component
MNRLASILPAAQVLVSVDATSKKRAFEEAGLLFENLHGLSRALITDSLFAPVWAMASPFRMAVSRA